MPELDRTRAAIYVALALLVCVLGARYAGAQDKEGTAPAPSVADVSEGGAEGVPADDGAGAGAEADGLQVGRSDSGPVTVHVAGAVRDPGVYRLRAGERVDDAVRRAGGATGAADLSAINLAAKVEDGRQVLVPRRAAAGATATGAAPAPGSSAPGGAGAAATGAAPAQPVNLNTATLEQLDALDGVGPAIANKILAYREENGGFGSVDELAQVPGIGEKRMAALRDLVGV